MAVITISRQLGSGGATIARAVSKELGFHLLDRELVDLVARYHSASPEAVRALDERASGWATSIVSSVLQALQGQQITQESYNYVAARVIHEAAESENVVILGRGAQVVLGKTPGTFHVHVVASIEERVARIVARDKIGPAEARREIQESDEERRRHVRALGPREWDDPLLYDLILNTDRLTPETGAGVVIYAARAAGMVSGPRGR
jgi:cytidylate kinase